MTLFWISFAMLWVIALIVFPVAIILLYQYSYLQRVYELGRKEADDRLEIGGSAPTFSARDIFTGIQRTSDGWRSVLLLAVSPDCVSCNSLTDELSRASAAEFADKQLTVLCVGSTAACKRKFSAFGSFPVMQVETSAASAFTELGLPAAIAVDENGLVEEIIRRPRSIDELVADSAGRKNARGPLVVNQEVVT